MPEQTQTPRVLWAQQHETVLLTIAIPDIEKVDVKFDEESVSFNGQTGSTDRTMYDVTINLYEKIDPSTSKYENIGQKYWRLLLKKKDSSAKFWPRLTKSTARLHWLQTDFNHWKDEDESDDEKGGFNGNFQDMFSNGKINHRKNIDQNHLLFLFKGMGGMGGMGGMPNMDDENLDNDESDSDDEKETTSEVKKTDDTTVMKMDDKESKVNETMS